MVRRQALGGRIIVEDFGIDSELYNSRLLFAIEGTEHGRDGNNLLHIKFALLQLQRTLNSTLQGIHHALSQSINGIGGIGSKEDAVVLQEQNLYVLAIGCLIGLHSVLALHSQDIARLAGIHPNCIGQQLLHSLFALLRAGQAVYNGGMYMEHILLGEQVVKQGFHRGTTVLAADTGIHHIGKNLSLSLLLVLRVLCRPHSIQQRALQNYKILRLNGSQRGTGAFDPQAILTLE